MTIETDNARLELAIAKALVEDAIAQGYTVSVFEGEDFAIKKSSSVPDVMAALASTDEDVLTFRDKDGKRAAWVQLIWGNGWDLISDESVTPETDTITARADQIADEAQEAYHNAPRRA